jgi:DNA-binding response OmpR family regulator
VNVVVVDGSVNAGRVVVALERGGHTVQLLRRPEELDLALGVEAVDAVVFNPDGTGYEFLPRMRRLHLSQPLVAWLARASSERSAELLEAGADEVLHAGMARTELVARLKAAAVRGARRTPVAIRLGPLTIDVSRGVANWNGTDLALTRRERQVLHALAESAGHTVRREELYRQVWGYTMARGDRSVDVNVKRLRTKLEAAAPTIDIKTQPGVGYRLELRTAEAEAEPVRDPVTQL